MNKQRKNLAMIGGAAFVLAISFFVAQPATAKTVALWPLEQDGMTGGPDFRCAIDNANAFTNALNGTFEDETVGWNLPPNPDVSESLLFRPVNRRAVKFAANDVLVSAGKAVSDVTDVSRDFTLEGWVKPSNVENGGWHVLAQANGGSQVFGGWIWSIRNTRANAADPSKKDVTFEIFWGSSDNVFGEPLTPAQAVDLTNSWHHVALVFTRNAGNGKSRFDCYYDGTLWGSVTASQYVLSNRSWPLLEIGGRRYGAIQQLQGCYDYWRLSDEALSSSSFLNAGGSGTQVTSPVQTTVAYWPLDCDENGVVDARDLVGQADLSMSLLENASNLFVRTLPSSDCAFDGNPPNDKVSLPNGNTGSLLMKSIGSGLLVPGLGDSLETTNSFTVEGWIKPVETDDVTADYELANVKTHNRYFYVFHTRQTACGWVLQMVETAAGVRKFQLIAEDKGSSGYLVTKYFAKTLGPAALTDWTHLALVYDHTAGAMGQGVWTLYGNGESWGSLTNAHAVVQPSLGHDFMMGGRPNNSEGFFGNFDCVRVSQAALRPTQLLCAAQGAEAATDVLAFWPMNVVGNLYLDLSDVAGPYSLNAGKFATSTYLPTGVHGDAPVIANPDPYASRRGRTSAPRGSVSMNGGCRYLMTRDAKVVNLMDGLKEFTLEFYVKRAAAVSTWEVLYTTFLNLTTDGSNPGCKANFTWRNTGFVTLDNSIGLTGDTTFPGSTGFDQVGEWMHIALTRTRTPNEANKVVYTIYRNGQKVSELAGTKDIATGARAISFFGRYCSGNRLAGQVSSMRLSNVVLKPSQFLCGTESLPTETPTFKKRTIAYWPLENVGGALDATTRTADGFTAVAMDANAVTASDDVCRHVVPHPDTNVSVRVKANVGSADFAAGGGLFVDSLGRELDPERAFTVEGWFRWNGAVTGEEATLFGTYVVECDGGWRLTIDATGAKPALKILAKQPGNWTPIACGTLVDDISDWQSTWVHLALSYDPGAGACGRWRLYRDGQLLGAVDNVWRTRGKLWDLQRFAFGALFAESDSTADGFVGGLDQCRVSDGALEPEAFLYGPRQGVVIIFK